MVKSAMNTKNSPTKNIRMKYVYLLLDTATYSGREIQRGIFAYAKNRDWVIEFENRGMMEPPLEHTLDRKWDGIIMRSVNAQVREKVQNKGTPHVELLGSPKNTIQYDLPKVVETAVRFMLDSGETRLAYYSNINAYWNNETEKLFLKRAALDNFEAFVYPKALKARLPQAFAYRSPELEQQFVDWIDALPKPIGILAPFPFHAARVVNACRRLGLNIPTRLSLLTASNDEVFCENHNPSLSCLKLDSYQFGYEAARLLDLKMSGAPLPKEQILISPKGIVLRNSTRGGLAQNQDIQQAVRLIRENATRGLRVQDLIDQLSISRRTLEREFVRILGRSPSAEINRIQMEAAVHQLKTTRLPISEVARRCGFNSAVYFSMAFRRKFGVSPQNYRKNHPS